MKIKKRTFLISYFLPSLLITFIFVAGLLSLKLVTNKKSNFTKSSAAGCCTGTSPSCGTNSSASSCSQAGCAWNCGNSDGFVRRDGNRLVLNGQTYKFVGFNRDNAATENSGDGVCGDGGDNPELYLDTMFDHIRNTCGGMNENIALRVWAFQKFTTYNSATDTVDFSQIDRVVEKAKRNGIKLIMTLDNNFQACTENLELYQCPGDRTPGRKKHVWYGPDIAQNQQNGISGYGYRTWKAGVSPNFGYDYPLTYRDYVQRIVTRYKNEPTILMWELMNEIEPEAVVSDKPYDVPDGVNDANCQKIFSLDGFYNFAVDMSQLVKSIDPNHLVALGTIGNGWWSQNNYEPYRTIFSIPTIDILDSHTYSPVNNATESKHSPWVDANLAIANSLQKPHIIGESGIKVPTNSATIENRANQFDILIDAYFRLGGDGYSIWSYSEGNLDPYHQHSENDVYPTDPTCPLIKKFNSVYSCSLDNSCTETNLSQPNLYQFIPSSNGVDYRGKTIQEICRSQGVGWNCSSSCKIYSTFDAAYHCVNCVPNQTISDTDCNYRIPSTATYMTGCCTLSSTLGTPTPTPSRTFSPTPTHTPTPTETRTVTPTPVPATGPLMKYNWNSSLQEWIATTSYVTSLSFTNSKSKQGAGSMKAVVNLSANSGVEARMRGPVLSPLQNWAVQGNKLSVYIFIPSGAPRNKLTASMFVRRDSVTDLLRSPSIVLVPGSWVKLTWLNSPISSIYTVGLSVFSTVNYSGNVFFDSFTVE